MMTIETCTAFIGALTIIIFGILVTHAIEKSVPSHTVSHEIRIDKNIEPIKKTFNSMEGF